MKRIKLAVCAAALMAMMGFSSCLNGDVNTTQQLSLILKAETDSWVLKRIL
jgi:predicted RND superfamily exporter protein